MVVGLRCSGSRSRTPSPLLAKGGHPLHLFPEQTAGISQLGDFVGGWGRGRYRDLTGSCLGPADVRGQEP
jgi:hypothetical protein